MSEYSHSNAASPLGMGKGQQSQMMHNNASLASATSTRFNTINGGSMIPLPVHKLETSNTSPRKKSQKTLQVGGGNVSEKGRSPKLAMSQSIKGSEQEEAVP